VKDLYARLGFAHVRDVGDTRVWRLDSADRLEVPPWFQVDRVVPATSAAAADNPSLITR
jgi:hypothetical protein